MIDVLNRGIGGQEAPEELARFQDDVIAEDAALVIWQVGTNAIYRSLYEPSVVAGIVATGLSWLKGLGPLGPDVILMDLQYARALFEDDKGNPDPNRAEKTREMEWRLADVAQQAEVNLSAVQADGAVGQRRPGLGRSDQQERQNSHDRMVHGMLNDGT
jgi:hypothetical protein